MKLYPNYLPGGEGTYFARTDSEKTLYIPDICSIMINRAGFDMNYQTLFNCVKGFVAEAATE